VDSTQAPAGALLDAALVYVSMGWPVLPLYPIRDGVCACPDEYKTSKKCKPAKHVIGNLVPHAHRDATTDPKLVITWWTLWPDANIGLALGAAGLVDVAPDSIEYWAEFKARGLPPTMHFASGGGEGHEHWLYDRGGLPRRRIARRGRFDILSDGYAVAPPSVHASGNAYRWIEWRDTALRPEWVVEVVAPTTAEIVDEDEVVPAETDEPPIDLTVDQLAKWNGLVDADDRSNGLVEIAKMLCDAGYQDVEGIASILAERDESLGWFKYSRRKPADAARQYRGIARRYGRPAAQISLTGRVSSRSFIGGPTGEETRPGPSGTAPAHAPASARERWTWAGEESDDEKDEQVWYIPGWVGPKIVTLVTAQTKVGKTTWTVNGLVTALEEGGEFCGLPVNGPIRVAYLTEERKNVFRQVLDRTGYEWTAGQHGLRYQSRADIPRSESFEQTIDGAVEMCLAEDIQVLVVDTLDKLARVYGDDENKAGVARKTMEPLVRAADRGLGVIILRHEGVEIRDVSVAGRGSSQYAGDADILISIRKLKGKEFKNHREIESSGRFGSATPDTMLVELVDEKRYIVVGGTVTEVKLTRPREKVVQWLTEQGAVDLTDDLSGSKIEGEIKEGAKLGIASTKQAISALLEEGRLGVGDRPSKTGRPPKGYWVVSSPAVPPTGEETPLAYARAQAPTEPDAEVVPVSSRGGVPPRAREKTPEAVAKAAEKKAAAELAKLEAADLAAPNITYTTVLTDQGLVEALANLSLVSVGLDTETTGLSAHHDQLRTINLSDGQTHVVIDTWAVTDLAPLQTYLDTVAQVEMHTYLFDLGFLAQRDLTIDPDRIYDVRTAAMVLESKEEHTDYRLQGIAKRHLAQHIAKTEQKRGWDMPVLRHAKLAYAAEDARVTQAAGEALRVKLAQDSRSSDLLACLALERDVQAATWWLASAGAPVDRAVMVEAIRQQEAELAAKLEILNTTAGVTGVNWRSPIQVLPILQGRGLELESTGEGALMDAESEDPLIDALLDYRSAGACLGLLRKAQSRIADDGRIYASFNPIGAQTGRTSCSDPNLQNLPRETLARAAIRPVPGRVFVRADYSQLQIVIAAWHAQDTEMIRVLNEPGGEVHQRTADALGCTRDEAKAVNFGFLFGAGAATFRREQRKHGIFMTLNEAYRYRETFMRTYRGIRSWHRDLSDWGVEETIFDPSGSGRRRSAIFSKNIKANTPVQMVEAHGFKLALQGLYSSRDAVPSARLVMMVHDELIAECDEAEAETVGVWLKQGLKDAMQPLVKGVMVGVEALIVPSYADADKKLGRKVVG
jgi:DNA polymerase-1